jgi:hypothetical protein
LRFVFMKMANFTSGSGQWTIARMHMKFGKQ